MSTGVKYVRIYSGPDGESHFGDGEMALADTNFAPPAPPFGVSEVETARGWQVVVLPPGWYGDWHTSPRVQVWLQLSGELEVEVGDGEVRRFPPGTIARLEDVDGQGHRTGVVGDTPVTAVFVQL